MNWVLISYWIILLPMNWWCFSSTVQGFEVLKIHAYESITNLQSLEMFFTMSFIQLTEIPSAHTTRLRSLTPFSWYCSSSVWRKAVDLLYQITPAWGVVAISPNNRYFSWIRARSNPSMSIRSELPARQRRVIHFLKRFVLITYLCSSIYCSEINGTSNSGSWRDALLRFLILHDYYIPSTPQLHSPALHSGQWFILRSPAEYAIRFRLLSLPAKTNHGFRIICGVLIVIWFVVVKIIGCCKERAATWRPRLLEYTPKIKLFLCYKVPRNTCCGR